MGDVRTYVCRVYVREMSGSGVKVWVRTYVRARYRAGVLVHGPTDLVFAGMYGSYVRGFKCGKDSGRSNVGCQRQAKYHNFPRQAATLNIPAYGIPRETMVRNLGSQRCSEPRTVQDRGNTF